jgi:hypothetical protein
MKDTAISLGVGQRGLAGGIQSKQPFLCLLKEENRLYPRFSCAGTKIFAKAVVCLAKIAIYFPVKQMRGSFNLA